MFSTSPLESMLFLTVYSFVKPLNSCFSSLFGVFCLVHNSGLVWVAMAYSNSYHMIDTEETHLG